MRGEYSPRTAAAALLVVSLVASAACQNIDTDQPILREANGLADDSLFGYSLVLHQTDTTPMASLSRENALSGAR